MAYRGSYIDPEGIEKEVKLRFYHCVGSYYMSNSMGRILQKIREYHFDKVQSRFVRNRLTGDTLFLKHKDIIMFITLASIACEGEIYLQSCLDDLRDILRDSYGRLYFEFKSGHTIIHTYTLVRFLTPLHFTYGAYSVMVVAIYGTKVVATEFLGEYPGERGMVVAGSIKIY